LVRAGRSAPDPAGSALGELGRADMPDNALAAVFGGIGRATAMLCAGLSGLGNGRELVFAPIGAVVGMIAGANR
jgi:hypothetical protein